jgi:hypothetical protein
MTSATSRIASDAFRGLENAPEIHTPVQLSVTGKIPAYVRGALYRTGAGTFRLNARGEPRVVSQEGTVPPRLRSTCTIGSIAPA